MTARRLTLASAVLVGAMLAGCATPPAPDPTAEVPYCHKTNKGRVIACTAGPVPSLDADGQAKQFVPDPSALTVYVVRRNWGDGRNFVKVQADDGATVETLPNTMVRYRLKPGTHTIAFESEGQRPAKSVAGKAGEVRFVRIDGMVWAWKSTFTWATESEDSIRERALKARLIADLTVR
ncbi:hypothetical protein KAK06_15520 [Ideonella sp. 4Y11]|uniref:DUF2846 domain-containing protein n=1 Tax=Ideonella aquatica TaxID=2824119 RepID=A0A940YM06_9BURK|nr:hypothetical protein [Ideonella aquatica]MBQ0960364.1 hypothetical protein [Ideonella aquatica]